MADSVTCPNCGSEVAPGATTCANCGHQLGTPPAPAPAAGAAKSRQPVALNVNFAEIRSRLGLEQSTTLTACVVLAIVAAAMGTYAHIKYLTASSTDVNGQLDAQVLFQLGFGCALAAATLAVLVRWSAGPVPRSEAGPQDLRAAAVLGGLAVIFTLIGLVLGMDSRLEASDSWFRYAQLFGVLWVAWLVISRPVPARFGGASGSVPSLVVIGAAFIALVVGAIMGQSDKFDTWVKGLSWEAVGIVALLLTLGWYLGLEERRGVVTSG